MTQIDRAGAIFTQLEEQSSKSVFDLSHLNEQKNKLEAEVTTNELSINWK